MKYSHFYHLDDDHFIDFLLMGKLNAKAFSFECLKTQTLKTSFLNVT